MYTLPKPDRTTRRSVKEIAAEFEAVIAEAARRALLGQSSDVYAPREVALGCRDEFWQAVAAEMDGSGWKLALNGDRDYDGSRTVVSDMR